MKFTVSMEDLQKVRSAIDGLLLGINACNAQEVKGSTPFEAFMNEAAFNNTFAIVVNNNVQDLQEASSLLGKILYPALAAELPF